MNAKATTHGHRSFLFWGAILVFLFACTRDVQAFARKRSCVDSLTNTHFSEYAVAKTIEVLGPKKWGAFVLYLNGVDRALICIRCGMTQAELQATISQGFDALGRYTYSDDM